MTLNEQTSSDIAMICQKRLILFIGWRVDCLYRILAEINVRVRYQGLAGHGKRGFV